MSEQDRYVSLQAEGERADRAEAQLQAARSEAAALREALEVAIRFVTFDMPFMQQDRMRIALSGDVGRAFLREHEAMRAALQWYADPDNYVGGCPGDGSDYPDVGGFVYDNGQRARDALSAPAAEPCCHGGRDTADCDGECKR